MRTLFTILLLTFVSAGAPKGKASQNQVPPTASPTALLSTSSVQSSTNQSSSSSQSVSSTNSSTATSGKSKAPTPAPVLLDLKTVATNLFRVMENGQYDQAARYFASGMAYITNGFQYGLDLSIPSDIKSIPRRNRTNLMWTYTDEDNYEIWGYCHVYYPNTPQADPEFIIIHFNKRGLIDVFAHIQPQAASCSAVSPAAFKQNQGSVTTVQANFPRSSNATTTTSTITQANITRVNVTGSNVTQTSITQTNITRNSTL